LESGIHLSTSNSTLTNGNVVSGNLNGAAIAVMEQNRGPATGACSTWNVRNNTTENNIVTLTASEQQAAAVAQDNGDSSGVFGGSNTFTSDTYNNLQNNAMPFGWNNEDNTTAQWQAFGLDVDGSFNQCALRSFYLYFVHRNWMIEDIPYSPIKSLAIPSNDSVGF
jgi:hypothetical protein